MTEHSFADQGLTHYGKQHLFHTPEEISHDMAQTGHPPMHATSPHSAWSTLMRSDTDPKHKRGDKRRSEWGVLYKLLYNTSGSTKKGTENFKPWPGVPTNNGTPTIQADNDTDYSVLKDDNMNSVWVAFNRLVLPELLGPTRVIFPRMGKCCSDSIDLKLRILISVRFIFTH